MVLNILDICKVTTFLDVLVVWKLILGISYALSAWLGCDVKCSDLSQVLPLCSCGDTSSCTGIVNCNFNSFYEPFNLLQSDYHVAQYENGTMVLIWRLSTLSAEITTNRPILTFQVSNIPRGYTSPKPDNVIFRDDVAPLISTSLDANLLTNAINVVGSRALSVAEGNAICLKMVTIKLNHSSVSTTTNIDIEGKLWPLHQAGLHSLL